MQTVSTCEATANIAVVKYWGKRDEKLVLPTNSSLSFTMDEQLKTRTTVMFSEKFSHDEFWLNGAKADLKSGEFAERMVQLQLVREMAGIKTKAKAVSLNCFPTSAGFASSAAGFAALACAASKAAGLSLDARELSILARRGSGSACRSVLGGFVEWKKGDRADGNDSYAQQIASHTHWTELRNVIAVVEAGRKKISSRAGMKQTVATSGLFEARLKGLPQTVEAMKKAVLAKDFPRFAELAMRESSNMHAVMLDTWPPIAYLNDHSKEIMNSVMELNSGGAVAGYTFDAGPNAHIYALEKDVSKVRRKLGEIPGVKEVIVCKVGAGPKFLMDEKEHLVDSDGNVREHSFSKGKGIVIS
ncbi:diphosphomevalonate decarboxylase [Candidatus Micrarchaeota archaeon]|nr:diphosphomevalonate decarboxylase [Candidatus Micrarchaeota archaeon]